MANYGYFDDQNREYVITDPKTPVKWINYIGTLAFGGFVDHTGGALICKGDPALNRITKYVPQLPGSEFKGETLYLRFRAGDRYKVFSPYFVPTLDRYDRYECHVGLGYTRIISEFYGIRTDVTIFVPPGDNRVIRDYKLTNVSGQPIELDAVPVVEYTHPDALKQLTNADWVPQTMQSRVRDDQDQDQDGRQAARPPGRQKHAAHEACGTRSMRHTKHAAHGIKILIQYPFMRRDSMINYFTSNQPASSFETDRVRFLGDHEYGTWANPLGLTESPSGGQAAELSNYEAHRGDNIAALLHHLGVIQPGETRRLITQLGQEESVAVALPLIRRYRDGRKVDAAFDEMARFWDNYLSTVQVETPDVNMNRMLNVYNPRQCHITQNWSRYLSLYQLGFGGRGIGFRDTAQDVMGIMAHASAEGRTLIEMLLSVQRRNGSAFHQFNPLTMVANAGDAREVEDGPDYYGDDHLWIVLAIAAYLKETGDLAFLEKTVPYYEKDRAGLSVETGTVLDHMRRAVEFTTANIGAHGLPLLGFADWNDTVNLRAGAESLFVAHLYGKALLEMIELARYMGDSAAADRYAGYYEAMKVRVNDQAWDGEWYVRYFDADGSPLGSKANRYGQIYVNGQSWPVIAGFATPDRARQALDSVYRRLNTRNGIKLSVPGFNGYDPTRGGITTYPPGAKENGGIFLHANPWVIMAEAMLGNGERAFEYYDQINPVGKNDKIDEFECEPYVYPQNVLSDEHPQFGLARNSWLTGTASWAYQAATRYILGISSTYNGLQIDPCIPRCWDGFKLVRRFRGAAYQIEVKNPEHVGRGVRLVRVNGQPIQGNLVSILKEGRVHTVEVVMG